MFAIRVYQRAQSRVSQTISISSCSALDFTVIDTVDIDNTSGNLPPLAERDEQAPSIVGGTRAADEAYPWFGRSAITFSQSGSSISTVTCGASLIHPRVAISAMHCANKGILAPTFYDISVTLYFGANSYDGSDAVAVRNVKQLWFPPEYNFPLNDIVLYIWDEPVSNIDPIAVNRVADLPSVGSVGSAIGFGLTTHQGTLSMILLQVDLNVVAASVCNNYFSGSPALSESELVCVRPPDGYGICQGDSGGPLFANVGGTLTLLGIASYVGRCGASPGGFTATSHFQQFLDKIVCDGIGGGYCAEDVDDEESDGGILGVLWGLFTTVCFCFT